MSNHSLEALDDRVNIDVEDRKVVLLVVDTLSSENVSFYGYDRNTTPFLDQLANSNLVFENSFSASIWSPPSQASILTGKMPEEHGYTKGQDTFEGETIATDFKKRAHTTIGISNNNYVSPESGFGEDFDHFEYIGFKQNIERYVGDSTAWKSAVESTPPGFGRYLKFLYKAVSNKEFGVIETGLRYLLNGREFQEKDVNCVQDQIVEERVKEKLAEEDENFFLYCTLMAPHDSEDNYSEDLTLDWLSDTDVDIESEYTGYLPADSELSNLYNARYDSSIRLTDKRVQRIWNFVREEHPDTIFVITSDHGENFGETEVNGHGIWRHGYTVTKRNVSVPLIVAGRDIPDENYSQPVSNLGIRDLLRNQQLSSEVRFQYYGMPSDLQDTMGLSMQNILRQLSLLNLSRVRELISGLAQIESVKKFRTNQSKGKVDKDTIVVENSKLDDLEFEL